MTETILPSFLDRILGKTAPAPQAPISVRGSASLGASVRNRRQQNEALWQAFRNNLWAYRGVRAITGALSKGYELVAEDEGAEVQQIPELEAFLNHPYADDSFEDLVGNIATQMLVFGACYLEVQRQSLSADQVRPIVQKMLTAYAQVVPELDLEEEDLVTAAVINGVPAAMQVLPAQQIEVIARKGQVLGYRQTTDDGRIIDFQPHEIVVLLYSGSMDKLYGDSPLEPISNSVVNDTLIRKRQQAKLLNLLGLEHVFVMPEDTSDENVTRFHETLATQYRGVNADGSFVVTNSGVKVEKLDDTQDGDFLKLREMHKEEIAMGLGVPLSVLGSTDGTSLNGAGAGQHYRTFIENTVRPLARHIQADLNAIIIEPYKQLGVDNVLLRLVLEDTQDVQALEDLMNTGLQNGTRTLNEVRRARGDEPYGDFGDIPFMMTKTGPVLLKDLAKDPAAPDAAAQATAQSQSPPAEEAA